MITTIWLFLKTTRWAQYALAGLAAAMLFLWWLNSREDAAVERDRAQAAAKVLKDRERADKAAADAVRGVNDEVETGNAKARDDASRSDDPLADGLRSLRAGKTSDHPAAD